VQALIADRRVNLPEAPWPTFREPTGGRHEDLRGRELGARGLRLPIWISKNVAGRRDMIAQDGPGDVPETAGHVPKPALKPNGGQCWSHEMLSHLDTAGVPAPSDFCFGLPRPTGPDRWLPGVQRLISTRKKPAVDEPPAALWRWAMAPPEPVETADADGDRRPGRR